jgi:NAD(P)-dependent dehydrogenase (short-subunit alcohol dehydrogenase family)
MGTMDGRVCIVTGANSGIGKETTRGLARLGATVVMACRNRERGEAARRVIEETGSPALAVMDLDLRSQASVRAFAREFTAKYGKLHVLVNNAGIYTAKRTLTEDSIESTFAVNHLSHFLLTQLLVPCLIANAPSRIVNMASEANQFGSIHLDDLNLSRRWGGFRAYCQSKLANILFAAELARRLPATVTANALHPGGVRTNLARREGGWFGVGFWLATPFLISAAKGADTVIWLASSPDVEGVTGHYFEKRRRIEPNSIARDPAVARRLWELSESMTGLRTKTLAGDPS